MKLNRRSVLAGLGAAAGLQGTAMPAFAQLKSMRWTSADIGSSGYVEASAIADALMQDGGTRIRVVPSGTSIGRMLQLQRGQVDLGFMANEVYFATEAIYDFAAREWGPQDLRALMGRPALFGIVTAGAANIDTIQDLKGKRVARIQAHPSTNTKVESVLAFGGLTWDDVESVTVPDYSAGLRAVIDGDVVAAGAVVGASLLRELEASPKGIHWPPIAADDQEGWDRMNAVAPLFSPATMANGPGASQNNPVPLVAYRYPILTVYADTSEEDVYQMTKAILGAYPEYKDANDVMALYEPEQAGLPPYDAPTHPGAVKYLEEIGIWTEEAETWRKKRLERLEAVRTAWDQAMTQAVDEGVADADWPQFWADYRAENL